MSLRVDPQSTALSACMLACMALSACPCEWTLKARQPLLCRVFLLVPGTVWAVSEQPNPVAEVR
eukprot:66162-Chlamydomonas_euryale.AAC.2